MSTIDERLTAVEVKTRGLEGKVVEVQRTVAAGDADAKTMIAALDARMERRFDSMEHRFDVLDRRFHWVLAIQFATLFAVLAAAFGVITKML